jgi:hypothetical protein
MALDQVGEKLGPVFVSKGLYKLKEQIWAVFVRWARVTEKFC